jgi:hypothetical protein
MIYRGQGFLAVVFGSFPFPTPPPPFPSVSPAGDRKIEKERLLADGKEGLRGWGRTQIILQRESLIVLYKSLNTLWCAATTFARPVVLSGPELQLGLPQGCRAA